jgi:hypothetical protein
MSIRGFIGGFVGFILVVPAYIFLVFQIGSLLHDVYGDFELGNVPFPAGGFICLAWLGFPVIMYAGPRLGFQVAVRRNRATRKNDGSNPD